MSTAAATVDSPAPAVEPGARPGFGRLTLVELRKMTDTRAGFWLLLVVSLLTVAAVALVCIVGDRSDRTFETLLTVAVQPPAILLPVVGILLVSSEWSQRTALNTFALTPRRRRVYGAKLLASVALSIAALAVSLAVAAAGTAIASPGLDHTWSIQIGMIGQDLIYLATAMITGVGFGAILLSSAPAIVVYFALPMAWSALVSISIFDTVSKWLDTSQALGPISEDLMSSTEWAHAAAALALWMLIPVLVGLWRIERDEIG